MNNATEFAPTYLCIKRHSITGLLYFCKSTLPEKQMLKYCGSGRPYWSNHLKLHDKKFVETVWYCLFYDKDEIEKFAVMCSEIWGIVEAKDNDGKKIWANLLPENGLGGLPKGYKRGPWSDERKNEFGKSRKGTNTGKRPQSMRDNLSKARKGKGTGPLSSEHKLSVSRALLGKQKPPRSQEHIKNLTLATKGKNKGKPRKQITCPHCNKIGGTGSMSRWHFNNCKGKT